jgi:hypothetical protein
MNEPKTGEDKVKWERFLRRLDRRYLHISPVDLVFRGSVRSAKNIAREVLETLALGEAVRVSDSGGTIWFQRRTQ